MKIEDLVNFFANELHDAKSKYKSNHTENKVGLYPIYMPRVYEMYNIEISNYMNQIKNLVKIAQELSELGFQDDANEILDQVSDIDNIDPTVADQTLINLIGGVLYDMQNHESFNVVEDKLDKESMRILQNSLSELFQNPDLT